MILTDEDKDIGKIEVRNFCGQVALKLKSFNTETKEAEVYATIPLIGGTLTELQKKIGFSIRKKYQIAIFVSQGDTTSFIQKKGEEKIIGNLVIFKCHLRGFKAYNKKTGEEIK